GGLARTDISVVGPMARDAADLALAILVLAGPDLVHEAGWRAALPEPRHRRLGDFRVAVWTNSPLCELDASVTGRFDAAVAAAESAGAKVGGSARPAFDDAEHQDLFMTLLRAGTASRMSDKDFAAQVEIAASLKPEDKSSRALVARGATLYHRAWGAANEARTKLRFAWREFFESYDVLLAPVAATAAFPHDHSPDRDARMVPVNGRPGPCQEQIFWAGVASLSSLPATAAPLGLTGAGLPVGCQIIGAEGEDLTTIEFARLLGAEIGGFIPPPAFAD